MSLLITYTFFNSAVLASSFSYLFRLSVSVIFGCWSALANPISTEVLGLAGFDWLVLDGEHAPNDINTFIPQLMALKGSHSAPVATGALWLPFSAISCGINVLISFGACSPSSTSQSNPARPSTSVLMGLASADQQPNITLTLSRNK